MNYIQQLQRDQKEIKAHAGILLADITVLKDYLTSSKFACGDRLDGYVNVQDVLNRLQIIRNSAVQIEDIVR